MYKCIWCTQDQCTCSVDSGSAVEPHPRSPSVTEGSEGHPSVLDTAMDESRPVSISKVKHDKPLSGGIVLFKNCLT